MHRRLLVASLCLSASIVAQPGQPSVLRIQHDFHFGTLNVAIPNPSSPGRRLIASQQGRFALRNDLTFTMTSTRHEVYQNGQFATSPDNDAGTYAVTPDSRLVLDYMPSAPGTDVHEMSVHRDATMFVGARRVDDPESFLAVALQTSTGQSNASLNGTYWIVSKFLDYGNGLTSGTVRGTAVLNGAGTITVSGRQQSIDASGSATYHNVGGTGSYNVAPDGAFSLSPTEVGGISPNGDVFFTVILDPNGTEVGMTVGVRTGTFSTLDQLAGSWGFAVHEVEVGTSPGLPFTFTEGGILDLDAQTATTGTYDGEAMAVESDPGQTIAFSDSFAGTAALRANGVVRLTDPGSPTEPTDFTYSRGADFLVATDFYGVSNLIVGVATCGGSELYGTPTPGTGGIAPTASMRGWPELGNPTFALRIVNGRANAAAVLPISLGPSAGFPFLGGIIWVDIGLIQTAPSIALSPTGEGALQLAVPNTPSLAGFVLFTQGLILDPGSPGGLAMTEGLAFGFCR